MDCFYNLNSGVWGDWESAHHSKANNITSHRKCPLLHHPQATLSWMGHVSCSRYVVQPQAAWELGKVHLRGSNKFCCKKKKSPQSRRRKEAVDSYGEHSMWGWKTQTCQLDGKFTVLLQAALWFVTTATAALGVLLWKKKNTMKTGKPQANSQAAH